LTVPVADTNPETASISALLAASYLGGSAAWFSARSHLARLIMALFARSHPTHIFGRRSLSVSIPWVVLRGDSQGVDRFSMPWNRTGKSVTRNCPDSSATD
jgi:hypothetical protein